MAIIKNRNTGIKLIFCFFLFVLIVFTLMSHDSIFAYTKQFENKFDNDIAFRKHSPTISEDFSSDRIIVTLKQEYSEVNKKIDIHFFAIPNVTYTKNLFSADFYSKTNNQNNISEKIVVNTIKDLTYIENSSKIVDKNNYIQIFSIELKEKSKENVLKLIDEFEKCDCVLAAEPDYNFTVEDLWLTIDDPDYYNQWGLGGIPGIEIESAWGLIGNGETNPRVRVGIFELGLQMNHPDLRTIQGSFTPASTASTNHGTHVAGIIGAIGDNGIGIAGISQAEIALLDRGPTGNLERPEFVQSLTWAIANDIRIANASFRFLLNGTNAPPVVAHQAAIHNFAQNGGMLICAAGNEANNNDLSAPFPAGYGNAVYFPEIINVISVGSIDSDGSRSDFSNYGKNAVHIFAPGRNIFSTLPNSSYGYQSGTSMAAPHVAGVIALLLSHKPELTITEIRNAIINNVVEVESLQNLCVSGGILNANAVVSSMAYNTTDIENNKIRIDSLMFNATGHIIIPRTINGKLVTNINCNAFYNQSSIEYLTIPNTLTHIGDYAFKNCANLTAVAGLNPSINYGIRPFMGCTNLYGFITSYNNSLHITINTQGYVIIENHNYTHSYEPIYHPYIKKHYAYCSCGKRKQMPCLGRYMGPTEPTYCMACGQEMTGTNILLSIISPNRENSFPDNPFGAKVFGVLVNYLTLNYCLKHY